MPGLLRETPESVPHPRAQGATPGAINGESRISSVSERAEVEILAARANGNGVGTTHRPYAAHAPDGTDASPPSHASSPTSSHYPHSATTTTTTASVAAANGHEDHRHHHQHSASQTNARARAMSTSRTASLRLDFLVIGGGISGLAAAFALARAGHRVRVLEKSETGLGRKAGGVRVPPNLSKILVEWGLEDELSQSTIRCKGSTFNSLETGETIGYLEWNEDVMKETGGSFLLMHHEDLHRMLHRLATAAGAQVEFGKGVRAVHAPPEGQGQQPSVELESGEAVSADIIIGADGYRSIVRPVVLGEEDQGEDVGMSVYTATIPMSAMMEDPDLRHFAEAPEWPMWMGDGRSILAYPIDLTRISEQRPGQVYNVHLFWPDSGSDAEEGWDQEVPMDMDFGAYDLRIQKLMKLVPSAIRTKVVNREMIEEWVDESGRIVLIGDAAHPTLPGSTHGCSLALEDAAVFGTLFSRLKNWDQVPQLLEAYQDLRQLRCTAVNQREVANKELVQIPPGPMRHNRDEEMRKAMQSGHDHWDESKLKKQWDEIAEVFAYNAFDASDDWYVSWGAIMEASRARAACDDLSVQVEIADAPAAP